MCGYGYPGGWLHNDLRGRQLVYEVHAMNVPGVEPGYFAAFARCQPEKVQTVAATIMQYVYRMALVGPTPDELELAKKLIITSEALDHQTDSAQASSAALNELYGLGYDFDRKFLDLVRRVTIDDAKAASRKYFRHYVLTVTAPDERIAAGVTPKPLIVK